MSKVSEIRPQTSDKSVRDQIMRLIREDFDPTPPNWEGGDWYDNAEDVADKILAVIATGASQVARDQTSDEPLPGDWNDACMHIAKTLADPGGRQ